MKETLLFRKGRCWRQLFLQGALLMIAMAPSALVASDVHVSSAKTAAEAGLVDVHALAPDIALDMRHASSNNFTGQVVPGCNAPRCYLLQPAAEALARVAHTLEAEGDRLQVSDCYRPVRSVKAFVAWAADLQNQTTRAQYYRGWTSVRCWAITFLRPPGIAVARPWIWVCCSAGRLRARQWTWAPVSMSSMRVRTPMRQTSAQGNAHTASACCVRWRPKDLPTIRWSGGISRFVPSPRLIRPTLFRWTDGDR